MAELQRSRLAALAALEASPALSIFMPAVGLGRADRQDAVRLKNLLREARTRLGEHGLDEAAAGALLEPVERWAQAGAPLTTGGGLALYAAPGLVQPVTVGFPLPERVAVGARFVVRPLLPLLAVPEAFRVLAVSRNQVRVVECDAQGARRLELADVPGNFDEALGYEEYANEVTAHSTSSARRGRPALTFHGYGGDESETRQDDIEHFLRRVADAVAAALPTDGAPVVLAAVEEYHPLFETANRGLPLATRGLVGNPELLDDAELGERARALLGELRQAGIRAEVERWQELRGAGRASADAAEILRAAHDGRVEVLFLAADAELWGSYEPDLRRLSARERPEPGDVELLDLAASRTLAQGGTAWELERAEMPGAGAAAAILRYAAPL
jgi:hypothetical protein